MAHPIFPNLDPADGEGARALAIIDGLRDRIVTPGSDQFRLAARAFRPDAFGDDGEPVDLAIQFQWVVLHGLEDDTYVVFEFTRVGDTAGRPGGAVFASYSAGIAYPGATPDDDDADESGDALDDVAAWYRRAVR
jgi:hypothetical protein